MKQIKIFFFLMAFSVWNPLIYGQITITGDDMPSPYDTVRLSTGINVDFVDYTETGEDFHWDFSGLLPATQSVDTFMKVTDTDLWFFFIYYANLSKPVPLDIPFEGIPINDVYAYYKTSGSAFKFYGYGAHLYGFPMPVVFSSPDILYRFPLNYGDADSSVSGVSFGLDNLGYILIDRHRKNSVDGWGTLTTPYGTFDVLRIKSEIEEYDSLYLDTLGTGIPVNRHYFEYKWMAKNIKEPLLTISTSMGGAVATYVDSVRGMWYGVPGRKAENVKLFPNPSDGNFDVRFATSPGHTVKWKLFNSGGKLLLQGEKKVTRNNLSLKLKNKQLPHGGYFLILSWPGHYLTRKVIIE